MAIDAMDEDALLQQALALSMQVDQPAATPAPTAGGCQGPQREALCITLLGLLLLPDSKRLAVRTSTRPWPASYVAPPCSCGPHACGP